jgi:hypothetical protein
MRTERQTDMTMLIVAFRNFANALKTADGSRASPYHGVANINSGFPVRLSFLALLQDAFDTCRT